MHAIDSPNPTTGSVASRFPAHTSASHASFLRVAAAAGLFSRAGPGPARWAQPLVVIGQTALFFYVAHLMLYRTLQVMWVSGDRLAGVTLPTIYLGWLAGLALLYPLCLLYGQFKQGTRPGSVWRMF